VVVETNGLADPAQSIKQFWFDEQMNIRAVLHSVVAVVSARKWPAIQNDPLLEKQLVFANKVLLSFLDVAAENRQQMEEHVRAVNGECELAGGEVDLCAFLEGKSLFCTDWEGQLVANEPAHHPGVRPVFLRGRATAGSKGALEKMVGELLWESGLEILRIKGVVCLESSPTVL
jgi:G3E family GTPase